MLTTASTWHVLRATANRERAAVEALQRLGMPTALPMARKWRPALYGRRRAQETAAVLLPGYVFLAAPVAAWSPVLRLEDATGRLVLGVLLSDGKPAVVSDAELQRLRRATAPIATGSAVDVLAGPFAGQRLTVASVDEARRLLTADVALLGSSRPVRLRWADVQPV